MPAIARPGPGQSQVPSPESGPPTGAAEAQVLQPSPAAPHGVHVQEAGMECNHRARHQSQPRTCLPTTQQGACPRREQSPWSPTPCARPLPTTPHQGQAACGDSQVPSRSLATPPRKPVGNPSLLGTPRPTDFQLRMKHRPGLTAQRRAQGAEAFSRSSGHSPDSLWPLTPRAPHL